MLNKVFLIGNLCADPETRFTQDGTCVCNLRLATSEKFKDRSGQKQEKTEFHRVVLWGKLGEIASKYLNKGSQVYIEGKIETRKWTNKDGQDQFTTEIRASEMKMLGGKGSNSGSGDFGGGGYLPGNKNDPFADDKGQFVDVPVDDTDLPF